MGKAIDLNLKTTDKELKFTKVILPINSKDSVNTESFIKMIAKDFENEVVLAIYENDAPTLGYSIIELDEDGVPALDDIMAGVGYFDADKIMLAHLNSNVYEKNDLNFEQDDFVTGLKDFFEENNVNYLGYVAMQENNKEVLYI